MRMRVICNVICHVTVIIYARGLAGRLICVRVLACFFKLLFTFNRGRLWVTYLI